MIQVIDTAIPPEGITPAAQKALEWADKYPYDGVPPVDAAHRTAQGILAELCDRRRVGDALDDIEGNVKAEIAAVVAEIIRLGMTPPNPTVA
ncbi:hypothetical protein QZM82_35280 [Burkholderia cepacia]|uniref:hypothetical protein n=1 Tax=Burkholderia cepacia TaxID=292 RepID=UPI0026546CAD|nr:hypothetical protein [Burkholderia cepacia]MDN7901466.1 hypothetical protein [Burkholderia cepacia]